MSSRRLSAECLETRQMAAADVTAAMINGSLYINEVANVQNGFDQAVMISSLNNGKVRVSGLTSQNSTDTRATRINGASSADFMVTGSIYVNFKDGGDVVKLNNLKASNVEISTGGVTWQWPDSDLVEVTGGNIRSLVVNTGIGNDTIKVRDTLIGFGQSGASYLIANSGDGADTIEASGLQSLGPVSLQTGNDADVLRMNNSTIHNGLKVDLGSGDDRFAINNSVGRTVEIKAGAGRDVGSLDTFYSTYNFSLDMGDGDDTLTVRNVDGATGTLDGGNGRDDIRYSGSVGKLGLRNWELFNGHQSVVTGGLSASQLTN